MKRVTKLGAAVSIFEHTIKVEVPRNQGVDLPMLIPLNDPKATEK